MNKILYLHSSQKYAFNADLWNMQNYNIDIYIKYCIFIFLIYHNR